MDDVRITTVGDGREIAYRIMPNTTARCCCTLDAGLVAELMASYTPAG